MNPAESILSGGRRQVRMKSHRFHYLLAQIPPSAIKYHQRYIQAISDGVLQNIWFKHCCSRQCIFVLQSRTWHYKLCQRDYDIEEQDRGLTA